MIVCHGFFAIIAIAALIVCGLSWLYYLWEIGLEVNNTLREDQRVRWSLTEKVPTVMHWLWSEHAKLFPESPKRTFAALSILLFFLIPIAALLACILFAATP
jgi:hypothetical protein